MCKLLKSNGISRYVGRIFRSREQAHPLSEEGESILPAAANRAGITTGEYLKRTIFQQMKKLE